MEGATGQAYLPRQRPRKKDADALRAPEAGKQDSPGGIASPSSSCRSPIWPPIGNDGARASSLSPRTPTPGRRGCRFPSLDEAHRSIAAARSQQQKPGAGGHTPSSDPESGAATPRNVSCSTVSSTSPTNNDSTLASWALSRSHKDSTAIQDASLTELTVGADALPPQDPSPCGSRPSAVKESAAAAPASEAQDLEQKQSSARQQPVPATPRPQSAPSSTDAAALTSMPLDPSTSTVDRICDQYNHSPAEQDVFHAPSQSGGLETPGNSARRLASSSSNLSLANLSELRSGAGARCGFRADDGPDYPDSERSARSSQGALQSAQQAANTDHDLFTSHAVSRNLLWPRLHPAGEAPPFSLPQIPTIEYSVPSSSREYFHEHAESLGPSISTIADSQDLLNGDFQSHGLAPQPLTLRAHPVAHEISPIRKNRFSTGATSMGATTTESNADPFEYDKYNVFPVSKKEREVSAVLQRFSTTSRTSKVTSPSPEKSPQASFRPPPPTKGCAPSDTSSNQYTVKKPAMHFHFLDQDAIKSSWQVHTGPGEVVKVPVRCSPTPPAPNETSQQPGILTEMNLNAMGCEGASSPDGVPGAPSDNDDWVTVATVKVTRSSPFCPPPESTPRNVMQMTGSSIADVSDDEICMYQAPFGEYSSTDRIIWHPSPSSPADKQPLKLRHIKDTKMPIFVPQQRVHRVNGRAQDSSHLLNHPCSRDRNSPREPCFRVLTGAQRWKNKKLPSTNAAESTRYEFRDSECSSSYGSSTFPMERPGKQEDHRAGTDMRDCNNYADEKTVHVMSVDNEDSFLSADISGTSHSFNFPLIPLPEAARLQALRRESGLEDPTVTGKARSHKSSFASSKRTRRSTFDSVKLPRLPEKAHYHVPTPLFGTNRHRRQDTKDEESYEHQYDDGMDLSPLSSKMDSLPGRYNRGSNGYGNSTATFGASPLKNKLTGIWPSRPSQIRRLYPWDERRLQQQHADSDPSLRALANRARLPGSTAFTYMSSEGRAKQQRWFLAMLITSTILPFLAVLVYFGRLDGLLSYYTKGEVSELTPLQRKAILAVMLLGFCLWTIIVVVVVKKLGGAF